MNPIAAPADVRERDDVAAAVPWPELVVLVRGTVRRIVGPNEHLDDLTQTALENVVRGLDGFQGRADLRTFVYRVAVNVALNHWRWWRRWLRRFDPLSDAADDAHVSGEPSPLASLEQARRSARVRSLIETLDAKKRIILVLSDFEELPASQIAEILGCPEPTVRSRLRVARAELADRVLADPVLREETAP
jgi:RNA polymerase sigma-70 factor (ECF subfamily)